MNKNGTIFGRPIIYNNGDLGSEDIVYAISKEAYDKLKDSEEFKGHLIMIKPDQIKGK